MGLSITLLAKNADPMPLVENISYTRWDDLINEVNYYAPTFAGDLEAATILGSAGGDPVVWDARQARLVGRFFLSAAPQADHLMPERAPYNLAHWLGLNFSRLGDDCAVEIG